MQRWTAWDPSKPSANNPYFWSSGISGYQNVPTCTKMPGTKPRTSRRKSQVKLLWSMQFSPADPQVLGAFVPLVLRAAGIADANPTIAWSLSMTKTYQDYVRLCTTNVWHLIMGLFVNPGTSWHPLASRENHGVFFWRCIIHGHPQPSGFPVFVPNRGILQANLSGRWW